MTIADGLTNVVEYVYIHCTVSQLILTAFMVLSANSVGIIALMMTIIHSYMKVDMNIISLTME